MAEPITRERELDELLIDAEADDAQVQQQAVVLRRPWLLLLGLVLVALNLRPALSSMAPVLGQVSEGLGLNASQAGLLTTLPVSAWGCSRHWRRCLRGGSAASG